MPTLEDYYRNKSQYGLEDYNTSTPEGDRQAVSYNPGYAEELLALRNKVESGQGQRGTVSGFNDKSMTPCLSLW